MSNNVTLRGTACGLLAATLLSMPLSAQITTHTLNVGGNETFSCSGNVNPATLSDGVTLASARVDFTFDASAGDLTIDVLNTSLVEPAVANPIIDGIVFNLPDESVSDVSLIDQSSVGGSTPAFVLTSDTNLGRSPNSVSLGCFGEVNVKLDAPAGTGIANPDATTWGTARENLSLGVTTFRLHLDGPGVPFLTARTIALQFSRNSRLHVNTAVSFRDGGPVGAAGEISSFHNSCFPTMWISDAPRLGTTIQMLFSATTECHTCTLVSWNPGPLRIGSIEVPIGAPLIFLFAFYDFPATPIGVTLPIPNDPALLEGPIYLTHVAGDVGVEFSEAFTMTFVR